MNLSRKLTADALKTEGAGLHAFAAELYPICRSITGDGLRETLRRIQARVPIEIVEVATGTQVFDWTVPHEWNIRDAYIKDATGKRIVDFQKCNLHVVNYSVPVRATMPLSELRSHLHSLPDKPNWIPYKTSYYQENWGFCLADSQLRMLEESEYEVFIDSTLAPGHLSYGEILFPGEVPDEVLISCHVCHPSLANDNLSGVSVAVRLAELLAGERHRLSYRFLFAPGTIGAITWLARNQNTASNVKHGLVLTCIGDRGAFHYKKSRQGGAEIDRAVAHVLQQGWPGAVIVPFEPTGYDERQYCSPGFNLAVGCLMRRVWGTFPEYHTSADNLAFINNESLAESLQVCAEVLDVLENDRTYRSLNPFCEPQLGKRGLYHATGGAPPEKEIQARLWVLNLSDGEHSLLDIAERAELPFARIQEAAELLAAHGLLETVVAGKTKG